MKSRGDNLPVIASSICFTSACETGLNPESGFSDEQFVGSNGIWLLAFETLVNSKSDFGELDGEENGQQTRKILFLTWCTDGGA